MRSLERFKAALNFEDPDTVPVAPMVNVPYASKLLGVDPWLYVTNPDLYVMGQILAQRRHGYDWIFNHQPIMGVKRSERESMRVEGDYAILRTELGVTLKLSKRSGPSVLEHPIRDYSDLDRLEVPDFRDPERLYPLRRFVSEVGRDVYICSKVLGPFHYSAEWFRGMERFLLDIKLRPDDARKLLEFVTELSVEMGRAQAEEGTHGVMLEDPSAASRIISRQDFERFVLPYERKICRELRREGIDVILHMCGDTNHLLDLLVQTGASCLSLDESVSLRKAREIAGSKCALFGNVPVGLISGGRPEDIEDAVRRCIEDAGKMGYIVSSSCGIHASTPPENLDAMVRAARRYGRLDERRS